MDLIIAYGIGFITLVGLYAYAIRTLVIEVDRLQQRRSDAAMYQRRLEFIKQWRPS